MNNETENTTPPVPVNKALTIGENRLAGSVRCMNCGTDLKGPFCYYCGQPDKNLMRFFPVLMRELLEDTLDFDSRFVRTIKPLLFRPGRLTRDYLDGKRFRFVPPLRLYIFSSIAFFFLMATLASDSIQMGSDVDDNAVVGIHLDDEEQEQLLDKLEQIDPQAAEEVNQALAEAQGEENDQEDEDGFNFNGEDWDRESNPLIIPMMPDWINEWVNGEIEESPQKGREIEENPNLMIDKMFELLPVAMFVLLPVVALLLKFWYLFAKKYYVEHLIFSLHSHSFLFVVIMILMLAGTFAGWREPMEDGPLTMANTLFEVLIGIWIPVYMLLALKRVYQQGWALTFAKFACISISYLGLLILTLATAALASFVLL